jgi:hypothetical protein
MDLSANLQPRPLAGVKSYQVGREMVLYLPGEEQAVSLNHSARAIWELCDGQRTLADIGRELGRRFESPAEAFLPDVTATVEQLVEHGLLELEPVP